MARRKSDEDQCKRRKYSDLCADEAAFLKACHRFMDWWYSAPQETRDTYRQLPDASFCRFVTARFISIPNSQDKAHQGHAIAVMENLQELPIQVA